MIAPREDSIATAGQIGDSSLPGTSIHAIASRLAISRYTFPSRERYTGEYPTMARTRQNQMVLKRLEQHARDSSQAGSGIADELLEDLVGHFHEFFHAVQPLACDRD